ncbi:Amuc_1101 family PilM-like pilus complex protein [Rubritalea marina]|uniref:Amuc_1101 family PilM-like pilus complex protein n=1 Tax=Rubritalea marina TaxID=361055 RepID=UPI00036642D3|nr:type IV pilus assembly protein PilM [Rubritalea marina]
MADSQSLITLNIGSQTLSMGVFSPAKGGGLIMKAYETTNILADPAADAARLGQLRMAIAELAGKLGVSKGKVDYAISGQSVFTRFVKLPMLGEDDLEQLVAFEAQQHVPFPINEVTWDWQLLESTGTEREVVLVAIKEEALDELNDCVRDSSLGTGTVDASPMALANAFKHNYGDVDETCLLIDVGARTSNLIYIEGQKIFTRSIAIGGAALTSAISKEYGVTYMEAESQKIANGLVALDTRHTSQLDELTGALATCIRTALNRMPAEIARTTNFYRSQQGGSAPTRVFLAGGGVNLPHIADFFQEKLRIPVEFFNPLAKVAVGSGVNTELVASQAHQLGEIVGLALRSTSNTPVNIDLVPRVVQRERLERKRRPFIAAAAALTVGAFALLYVGNMQKAADASVKLAEVKERVSALEEFAYPIEEQIEREDDIFAHTIPFLDAHDGQRYWLNLIDDLKQRFGSTHVWVTDFSPLINYSVGAESKPQTAVRSDFATLPYGKSGMADPKLDQPKFLAAGRENPRYVPPLINAVRIKGMWRGAGGASQVNELVKSLTADDSKYFTLEVKSTGPGRQEVQVLTPAQYSEIDSMLQEGQYAAAFTITIPLKQPLPLR